MYEKEFYRPSTMGEKRVRVRIKGMRASSALIPWFARAQEEAQALFLNKPCATELESDLKKNVVAYQKRIWISAARGALLFSRNSILLGASLSLSRPCAGIFLGMRGAGLSSFLRARTITAPHSALTPRRRRCWDRRRGRPRGWRTGSAPCFGVCLSLNLLVP